MSGASCFLIGAASEVQRVAEEPGHERRVEAECGMPLRTVAHEKRRDAREHVGKCGPFGGGDRVVVPEVQPAAIAVADVVDLTDLDAGVRRAHPQLDEDVVVPGTDDLDHVVGETPCRWVTSAMRSLAPDHD